MANEKRETFIPENAARGEVIEPYKPTDTFTVVLVDMGGISVTGVDANGRPSGDSAVFFGQIPNVEQMEAIRAEVDRLRAQEGNEQAG